MVDKEKIALKYTIHKVFTCLHENKDYKKFRECVVEEGVYPLFNSDTSMDFDQHIRYEFPFPELFKQLRE